MSSSIAAITPRFHQLDGLVGRETEIQSLYHAYERVMLASPPSSSCEAVLIHGESGTGKTALVRHCFQRQVDDGTLISGKFDIIIRNQMPYSAIVDALTQLCLSTFAWKNMTIEAEQFQANLRERLSNSDMAILTKLVPAVVEQKRVSIEGNANDGDLLHLSHDNNDNSFAFARFADVVRCFIYMVARFLPTPLILFLDDVQAADAESLSLISALTALHAESCNLLLVLAYRSHADVEQQPKENNFLSHTTNFRVTDIQVRALDEDNVNKLISKLLRMDTEETISLSRLVAKRTGGNIYFVLQTLEALTTQTFLAYSIERCRWEWNMEKIRNDTNVTDNMAQLLTTKVCHLSPDVQSMLQLAACLGFYFDIEILDRIMMLVMMMVGVVRNKSTSDSMLAGIENLPTIPEQTLLSSIEKDGNDAFHPVRPMTNDTITQFLSRLIAVAVEENLIDQASGTKYRFTHDRVFQAVYEMIPAGRTRDTLHWRIGQVLWNELQLQQQQQQIQQQNPSQITDDWLKFAAADQLNRGCDCGLMKSNGVTLLDLARLNLEAGKVAIEKSAFKHAAGFFDNGVKWMQNRWQSDYSLCLELHTLSMEAEYTACNFEKCNERISDILANARCVEDKLRAYFIKAQSKGVQGNILAALDDSVTVLKLLGERIPRRPNLLHVVLEQGRTKRVLQKRKVSDFVWLPDMTNPMKIWAITFLQNVTLFSCYAGKNAFLALSVYRMVQLTVQYGISVQAPYVVASYGVILACLGDFETAYQAGQVALELAHSRPHTVPCHARTVGVVFGCLDHLKQPITRSLDHCMNGYYAGMKNGEVEGAATLLALYVSLGVYIGKNLDIVLSEMVEFHQAYRDVIKCNSMILCIFPYHQFALNLMGQNENPLKLTGTIMNEDVFLMEAQRTGNAILDGAITVVRMMLLYIFCDMESASHMVAKLKMEVVSNGANFATPFLSMYAALIMLAMARKTRNKRTYYLRRANVFKRILQKYVSAGNINFPPMLELVSAEQRRSLRRRRCSTAEVKKGYESAVRMASQSGFSVVEAVGNERAGEYMLSIGDTFWAETFLVRAFHLYAEWGAKAKTKQLNDKYTFLASVSSINRSRTSICKSVSVALRKRYSYKETNERQRLSLTTSS